MKKLFTLILAFAGFVVTASADYDAYNSGYLALHFNFNGGDWDYKTFENKGANPGTSQVIYEYLLDKSHGLTDNTDVYFRLKYEYEGSDYRPSSNSNFPFVFNEGVDGRNNGQYGTYNITSNVWKGDGSNFIIQQSSIKASAYRITVYAKIHDDVQYSYNNELYLKVEIVSMPLTITNAGYATFSCDRALDFTSVTDAGVTAYYASRPANGTVSMVSIPGNVPPHTGLFIKGAEGTYNVSVVTTSAFEPNDWKNINYLWATDGESVGAGNYVFAKQDDDIGFYRLGAARVIEKGKAYLSSGFEPAPGPGEARLSIIFDDASAISSVKSGIVDSNYYDIQGRRVAQPTKGLYIVNGKKVIK